MGLIRDAVEAVFPAVRANRELVEQRAAITKALYDDLLTSTRGPQFTTSADLKEGLLDNLGSPWQAQAMGLLPTDSWKRGFPFGTSFLGLQQPEMVVNSDALRQQCLAFARHSYYKNPHARAVINTIVYYVCGAQGWTVKPLPKFVDDEQNQILPISELKETATAIGPVGDKIPTVMDIPTYGLRPPKRYEPEIEPQVDKQLAGVIERAWTKYCELGNVHPTMSDFQLWWQFVMRLFRDGEVFLHLGHQKSDKKLQPRFLEPEDINTPDCASNQIDDLKSTGIEVDENDEQRPIAFWWKPHQKTTAVKYTRIPASEVLYARWDWDSGLKRGLPALFCVYDQLADFERWMRQAMRNQRIQGQVAILRQWQNTDMAAIQAAAKSRTWIRQNVQTPAGSNIEYNATEMGPILDAPAGMQMTGFAPRSNAGESEILIRRVLLSVAAGLGLTEAMVTADASNGNYASSRVATIVTMRMFEAFQSYIGGVKQKYYKRWLATEIMQNRLPRTNDTEYDCAVSPTPLPPFELETIVGAVTTLLNTPGMMDPKTAQEMLHLDPKSIKSRLKEDQQEAQKQAEQAAQKQAAIQATTQAQAIAQTMPSAAPADQPVMN